MLQKQNLIVCHLKSAPP